MCTRTYVELFNSIKNTDKIEKKKKRTKKKVKRDQADRLLRKKEKRKKKKEKRKKEKRDLCTHVKFGRVHLPAPLASRAHLPHIHILKSQRTSTATV